MIFAVISQKGGAGKTAVATNLASELNARAIEDGQGVLLVDADPQRSAADWSECGLELGHDVPTTVAMGADMHKATQLPRLSGSYRHVVIDTPPGHDTSSGRIVRAALLVADVALVVCRPSPPDLRAIGRTLDLVDDVRETIRPGLQAALVISQSPTQRTLIAEDSIRALREQEGLHVCDATLYTRTAYQVANAVGLAITRHAPRSKAAREFDALVDEVLVLAASGMEGAHVEAA